MPLRARAAHPQPGEARGLGQALGAEHDQRHDRNDDQFGKTEIEHGAAAAAAASAPRVFVLLRVPLAVGFALLVLEAAGGRVLVGVAHALLEALDGLAQVTPGATQALGAEDEEHDHQHDDPMPDAESAHSVAENSGVVGAVRIPQPWRPRVKRGRGAGSDSVVERLAANLALAYG